MKNKHFARTEQAVEKIFDEIRKLIRETDERLDDLSHETRERFREVRKMFKETD